jgi:two-component system, OmpR family, phosphate regulon sensor histidine kinase PhoR
VLATDSGPEGPLLMKLRTRIAVTYISLTVAGVVLVSVISSWQIRQFLVTRSMATLVSHVDLFTRQIEQGVLPYDGQAGSDTMLSTFSSSIGVRLSLINARGLVIFDSNIRRDSLRFLENHATRPEIVAAQREGRGSDQRRSASTEREYIYAARRLAMPAGSALEGGYIRLALPAGDVQSLDGQIQTIVWMIGFAVVLIVAFVSLHVAGRITRPIMEIARTTHAISRGDLTVRVQAGGGDEIASLAAGINEMAATLGEDMERQRKLERVRSEFLGNVSHELRTPIFSIQGFLETLMDGAVDDPAVNRDFLAKAHRHAERLNALLNDLIEISRIESGEMKMSFRWFLVNEFLEGLSDDLRPLAERKKISLVVEYPAVPDLRVFGDRDRLKQVMVNLIENALKYTEPGGTIRVNVGLEEDFAAFVVADTGIGIAEEHLGRIFERFYRVDKDRAREVGGTGLGLAIVKHIVEAHGGTIAVRSEPGKGSVFTFTVKR